MKITPYIEILLRRNSCGHTLHIFLLKKRDGEYYYWKMWYI